MPSWERTNNDGDTITLTVDEHGAAVSVQRIYGAREGYTLSHEALLEAWLPWLEEQFEDDVDAVREAVEERRRAAELVDDEIP